MRNTTRRAATVFIFITVLIDMLTFGMIGPVLPKLIASFVGYNYASAAEIIGIFATVWALMQFFCSPLLGMLSDRIGRRPVILVSNAVAVVDFAIMALAPNLWWLFAGRVLSGIASSNITAASAYIADVTPPEKRAAAFGMLGSAFGLGFVLGPAVGGLVGNVNPRLAFWAAAAFALLNTLYGLFVLPESLPRERRTPRLEWKRANPVGSLKLLRSHHELWGLTWVNFITYLAHEVFPNIWVIYCIAAFGWSTGSIGLTLALVGTVAAVNQATMIGPVVKRLGERRTLLASLVLAAIGLDADGNEQRLHLLDRRSHHLAADVSSIVASLDDPARQRVRAGRASGRARIGARHLDVDRTVALHADLRAVRGAVAVTRSDRRALVFGGAALCWVAPSRLARHLTRGRRGITGARARAADLCGELSEGDDRLDHARFGEPPIDAGDFVD